MLASLDDDPPESTRLRIGDEVAWSDVNGVYDRDHSLKENTNPKCLLDIHHQYGGAGGHHHHHHQPTQMSRFSGNLKPTAAPIIGLSGTLGGAGAARRHHHHHHHAPTTANKKSGAKTTCNGAVVQAPQANKASTAVVLDPGSPRVSCFGTVDGSEEGRERAIRRLPSSGCCGRLGRFLMRRGRSRNTAAVDELKEVDTLSSLPTARKVATEAQATGQLGLGLGAMRRFSSGRRAAAEAEGDGRAARSGAL